ncbi:hypothetical protein [Chryseobacterium paridis]|uniref:Uncharacterized protein n=1 Tax=Chryseobacterium paridis TaxID=2800328 RepID=A0ABS1FY20_9FLAO|nr:hypothetical protein [Chryseobacterium paridis]MBK1897351.1 hypothetical protein [Chryseobacterium paridis]
MLFTRFLLIVLFFASATSFAQMSDALRLNVRLYPVQILSINHNDSDVGKKDTRIPEIKSITVSSPSGFEVKAHHERTSDTKAVNSNCNKEYNLIGHQKGVVQEVYKINEDIDKVLKKIGCDSGIQQDHLVLTLISQ